MLWRFVLCCVAALLAAPAFAATETAPDSKTLEAPPAFTAEPVYSEFNLLGRWAHACDKPPSPSNPHVSTMAAGNGLIVETHDVGTDFAPNLYHAIAARRVDKSNIEARVLFRPGAESEEDQTIVVRLVKDKAGVDTRRTMFNRSEDGVRVKNGVAVNSGRKTLVLKRCG